VLAFVYSYGFVVGILVLSTLLEKAKILNDEGARKFIHIAVAHWFILAIFTFDNAFLAALVPFTFILLNYLSWRFNLLSALERDDHSLADKGTIYYAVSLTIITFIAFSFDYQIEGLFAVLAMGYGDGFSALIGRQFGNRKIYRNKSYAGSLAMFGFTLIIGLLLFNAQWHLIIFIALAATALEMFTLKGYDNLSVPLTIFLLAVVIL